MIANQLLANLIIVLYTFVHSSPLILTWCAILVLDLQITQPPTNFEMTFDESTSFIQLMCSLNIDIPSSVMVTWTQNGILVRTTPPNEVTQTGNTATLLIGDPQPSDAGDYACSFTFNGLLLQRRISLGE